jgi:hypothetical protein
LEKRYDQAQLLKQGLGFAQHYVWVASNHAELDTMFAIASRVLEHPQQHRQAAMPAAARQLDALRVANYSAYLEQILAITEWMELSKRLGEEADQYEREFGQKKEIALANARLCKLVLADVPGPQLKPPAVDAHLRYCGKAFERCYCQLEQLSSTFATCQTLPEYVPIDKMIASDKLHAAAPVEGVLSDYPVTLKVRLLSRQVHQAVNDAHSNCCKFHDNVKGKFNLKAPKWDLLWALEETDDIKMLQSERRLRRIMADYWAAYLHPLELLNSARALQKELAEALTQAMSEIDTVARPKGDGRPTEAQIAQNICISGVSVLDYAKKFLGRAAEQMEQDSPPKECQAAFKASGDQPQERSEP